MTRVMAIGTTVHAVASSQQQTPPPAAEGSSSGRAYLSMAIPAVSFLVSVGSRLPIVDPRRE